MRLAANRPLIWLAFVAIVLSGCDSAEELVNRRLPPVPAEQHRASAIQAAQAAIAGLTDANAGFNLPVAEIAAAVKASGLTQRLGLARLTLRGDRQLILAEVEVDKKFSKDDFPELDESTKGLIDALKPEIKGRIDLGLGLTSTNTLAGEARLTIDLRLRPLFWNTEVERLVLAGKPDVDLLVTLVNRLADRIANELSHIEIARASFPAVPFKQSDLSRSIALKNSDGADEKITISAKAVSSPVEARSVAWLVDGDNVTFIAELAAAGTSSVHSSAAPDKQDFARMKAEFSRKLVQGLGVADPTGGAWIAAGKPLVAELVNAGFRQGQPCIALKAALADRDFGDRIEIPDNTAVDCSPKIDCTPTRDCNVASICEQADDCSQARNCQVCALGACFDDPACARARAVAQHNCEIRAAARKIDCERLGTPQKTACERERAAERASCETRRSASQLSCESGKQALEKLAGTGNIAGLAGKVAGSADISICLKELAVAPSLERLEASAVLGGQGAVDLGIKYTPLGIADYFACQFPWMENKHISIALPDQPVRLDAALVLESSASSTSLRASIKTAALAARLRPDLRELFLENYDMRATCAPVGGMLHEVTLDVTSSVPEIDGDFRLRGDDRTLVLTLEPMTLHISGVNVVAKASYGSNAKALILNGDPPAVPAN